MKNKKVLIFFLFFFLGLLSIAKFSKGGTYNLIFLETNQEVYYIDEKIVINASWELNYNIGLEFSYIQIQIYDIFNNLLWNSSEYDDIGIIEKNLTINILDLNISYSNYSNILFVKCFYYNIIIDTQDETKIFLETVEIEVIKKEVSCELIGFTENIAYGDDLSFKAKFYDELNNSELINQTILFKINSSNLIVHQNNFTTNASAMIKITLSSNPNLKLGLNYLIFTINNNKIYNDKSFNYNLFVEKCPIFIEIIQFNDTLGENEDLRIKLFYFFIFNNNKEPLKNYPIKLEIYGNALLKCQYIQNTSNSGILSIKIAQENLSLMYDDKELSINFIFNGTSFIKKKVFSLMVKIDKFLISELEHSFQIIILSSVPVLTILLTSFSLIIYNNKSHKPRTLAEITFKY